MNRSKAIELLDKYIHTNKVFTVNGRHYITWTSGEAKFEYADKDSRFTLVDIGHNDIRMQEERTYRFVPKELE